MSEPVFEFVRVVVDLNVLVSGIINNGPPSQLLRAAAEGKYELCISRMMLNRLEEVLGREKFVQHLARAQRSPAEIVAQLAELATLVVPTALAQPVTADEEDDRVLATALAAKADWVVSGDRRHLLSLQNYKGIRILPPRIAIVDLGLER